MSALSPCHTNRPARRSSESVSSLLIVVALAGYGLLIGLGQLQLRFSVDEMNLETTRLQNKKMELQSELKLMRAEVQACKQSDRLVILAEGKFGLEPYAHIEAGSISVPEFVRLRYAAPEAVDPYGIAASDSSVNWISKMASRLGLSNSAFAEETKP